jgi:hypothetical protein
MGTRCNSKKQADAYKKLASAELSSFVRQVNFKLHAERPTRLRGSARNDRITKAIDSVPTEGTTRMCEKCRELDRQIAEYHRQIHSSSDLQEVENLQVEVRKLIGQKIGFHVRRAS